MISDIVSAVLWLMLIWSLIGWMVWVTLELDKIRKEQEKITKFIPFDEVTKP